MKTNLNGKIGCEVECYILRSRIVKVKALCTSNKWKFSDDGSISTPNYSKYQSAEIKVGIYKLSEIDKMIDEVKKLLLLVSVNRSCGLHVHISFANTADYYKLLTWKYVNDFQNLIKANFTTGDELERLNPNGRGHFCRLYQNESEFLSITSDQLRSTGKSYRYNSVNFNAYNLYGTIEYRIFPATNKIIKFKKYLSLLLTSAEKQIKTFKLENKEVNLTHKKKKDFVQTDEIKVITDIITKKEKEDVINSSGVQNE